MPTFHPEPFTSKPHNQRGTRHLRPCSNINHEGKMVGRGRDTGSRNSDHGGHQGHQKRGEKLHSAHGEGEAPHPQIFNSSISFLAGETL